MRSSPVSRVFLTNADLDHVLGLFLLREGGRLAVTAPSGVREALTEGLKVDGVLAPFGGIAWSDAPEEWSRIDDSALEIRAVPLPEAEAPRFAPDSAGCHGVGYLFRDVQSQKTCGIFPDVARLDAALLKILAACDRVYFDGTFWDEDEMPRLGLSPRRARDMGHLPVSESLGLLANHAVRAAYVHVNNTNPILRPGSPERCEIERRGLRVAEDGERLSL